MKPLPFAEGTGDTIQPPLGVGTNKGQQIPNFLCKQWLLKIIAIMPFMSINGIIKKIND